MNATDYLVDVRTPAEFRSQHLPQSINLPLADLRGFATELKERSQNRRIVLVCRTGQRAEMARKTLESEGLPDTSVLEGGIEGWGGECETGRAGFSLERQVRIAAGSLVLIGVLLSQLWHPAAIGLSGFVGAGLVFAGLTDTCGMGILLSYAPWNRVKNPFV